MINCAFYACKMYAGIHIPMFTTAPQLSRGLDYMMVSES